MEKVAVRVGERSRHARPIRKLRSNSITVSPRWLTPRVRTSTIPWPGRDLESRTRSTSVSACSVSPAKTGRRQRDLLPAEVRDGVLGGVLHAQPVHEREREEAVHERLAELRLRRVLGVEVDLVRVVRDAREPEVVGVQHRAPDLRAVAVPRVEVAEASDRP